MATSKRSLILREVAKHLPLQQHRSCLYIPTPVYMTRGISVERTPYKDAVCIRLLNLAFFEVFPVIHLSYSPRIKSSPRRDLFEGSPADIANLVLQAVERDELATTFSKYPSPEDFLRIIDQANTDRTSVVALMDRGACQALLKRTEAAIQSFQAAEARQRQDLERFSRDKWAETNAARCRHFACRLQEGQDITTELRHLCHDHAIALGFKPAPLLG